MSIKSEFLQHFPDFTWDLTPEVIEKRSMDLLSDTKKRIDNISCLPGDKINFESVCESLADIEAEIERERSIIEVYLSASPVGQVRDKCFKLCKTWSYFFVEISMRRDIYYLLTKVQSIEKSLPYESARYLEKSLLNRRRNGLHLEEVLIEKLTALKKKISNLCIDFNKNLAEDDTKICFEKQELLGMPDEFFNSLTKIDGKYILTLKYLHVVPILKKCKVIKTRQIMEKAHNSRCIDQNVKILEEILELRNELVTILGYKTHTDLVTNVLVSKSAENVHLFLMSLFEKIQYSLKKEMNRLLELKKKDCQEMGVPFDGKINMYDSSYYQHMVLEKDYHIDKYLIKEYFPLEHVTKELFDIYQSLLDLKFEQVADPLVIHPDVLLYAVYDKATNSLMGYFYMDLFPRPFKYSHAICFAIQPKCHYKNKPQVGCVFMIANFTKPSLEKPSLLNHREVIIYFHEFGHVLHQICSKTRYSIFHAKYVERDFVEAPSQMLENWCWEKESLKKISSHYKSGEPLPDDLIEKIIKSRRANISIFYARQISLAMFDYIIHTSHEDCMIKYSEIEPTSGTNFAASFGYMCGGYDAKYYGYLWSQMCSYDMFSKFKKEGIFNLEPGLRFRNMILLHGGTKDGGEMVREFLGRDPILDAFIDIIGIK